MPGLSRKLHCALAGIDVDAFKALQHRQALPVVPRSLRGNRAFSPIETLTLAAFELLCTSPVWLPRQKAAGICSAASAMLAGRWSDIVEGSKSPGDEQKKIQFGQVMLPGGMLEPVCGRPSEIASQLAASVMSITISISHVAAMVHNRGRDLGIDLDQFFWSSPALSEPSERQLAKFAKSVRKKGFAP